MVTRQHEGVQAQTVALGTQQVAHQLAVLGNRFHFIHMTLGAAAEVQCTLGAKRRCKHQAHSWTLFHLIPLPLKEYQVLFQVLVRKLCQGE